MRPILYAKNTTIFTNNGLGVLRDAAACIVTEERNGSYELAMEYPLDGFLRAEIAPDCIIKAKPNETSNPQLFRVYNVSKPLGGLITINAEHISYQLSFIPVTPFLASYADTALSGLVTNAAINCPFTVWTDIPRGSAISFNNLAPSSFRSNLAGREGSILDLYGGEYEFDNYAVKLHQHRGADNGVRIVYGKNLIDLNQEENIASAITGIYPYWTDGAATVTLTEKVVQIQSAYAFPRVIALDMSRDFSEQPTEAELRAAATVYINRSGISSPSVSIRVSFVQLWQTAGYEDIAALEHVSLCDTVTVHMDKLGVDTSAKVIRTVYDSLNERYDSIDLGDPRASIAETIAHQQEAIGFVESNNITLGQVSEIANNAAADVASAVVTEQTNWISGGVGGNVFFKRNAQGQPIELVWLDTNSLLTARNVFRININGLGFSSTGYAGPYTSAWTSDGKFSADFIKVGKIASANGKFNIDLSQNTITIKNSGNTTVFSLDADGNLKMAGEITADSGEIGGFTISASGLSGNTCGLYSGVSGGRLQLGNVSITGNAAFELSTGADIAGIVEAQAFHAQEEVICGDLACDNLYVEGSFSASSFNPSSMSVSGNITAGTLNSDNGIAAEKYVRAGTYVQVGTMGDRDGSDYPVYWGSGSHKLLKGSASSRRYKRDIEYLDIAAYDDVFSACGAVKFRYKDREYEDGKYEYGLIAEDVYEKWPHAIIYKKTDNGRIVDGIDYAMLTVPLIIECQNLRKTIRKLDERIAELEGKLGKNH